MEIMKEEDLKKILIENKELLEENKLNELYEKFDLGDRVFLTQFFINNHINPLDYMNNIPSGFNACNTSLLEIEIPERIITINEWAFSSCVNLRKVTTYGTKLILTDAFSYCRKLEEVKLGRGATQIITSFYGCINLKNIKLPETLEYINSKAFYGCYSLKKLKLPEGLKVIDVVAFPPNLDELIIPKNTNLGIPVKANKTDIRIFLSSISYPITYKGVKYSNGSDFYFNIVEDLI